MMGFVVCTSVFSVREWRLAHPGGLVAHFLDVGQGDCAFLITPNGHQIVVDGGRDLAALPQIGADMPLLDHSIDLLVLSHPQLDHIFALPELLRRYHVGAVLMTGLAYNLRRYDEFLTLIAQQHVPVLIADPNKDLTLDDGVTLDTVWPPPVYLGKTVEEANNTSIALHVRYGSSAILFTGDMEEIEEEAILGSHASVRSNVLKVAHHGSKTSSSTGFLLAVHPSLAVISAGRHNTYGHPHKVTLERFHALKIPVRVTAWEGTIDVFCTKNDCATAPR
jgi:competence protein ComEC